MRYRLHQHVGTLFAVMRSINSEGHMETEPRFLVSSDRLVNFGIEPLLYKVSDIHTTNATQRLLTFTCNLKGILFWLVCPSVCLCTHAHQHRVCVEVKTETTYLAATSGNEISLHFRASVITVSPQACRSPSLGLLCLLTCFSIKVNEINESYTLCQVRDKHTVGDSVSQIHISSSF